ncbi:uncharacterized protein [Physcomitrium patens]|uniref:Glycine cleavage system H protein n=1 Tax=Physcomitrium patens TaxID=3218 RepID=A9TNF2_PHYPA|nr:uncharacterized protein LOC112272785 [Physcomitrium patens]PNR34193.1 hypothetical protein PHYPA_024010 [Physcomitrium patens]|eukprot:XP_024356663.1 uncharacterized protein LOC112272785 [Physcomitrella patens]
MALRSAATQAATLLRLRGRPALTQSIYVPLARRFSTTQVASDEVRDGLHYAETHEWVKVDGDIGTIGISDHAQKALGDLVFIELPEGGSAVTAKTRFGLVESVKAVSEVYSPVSGEVVETNSSLSETPETVNSSPYDEGWLIKVKLSDKSELENLMNKEKYAEHQDGH